MTDTKKEVKVAAKLAMDDSLSVAGNSDIAPVLEDLVNCIIKPAQVTRATKKHACNLKKLKSRPFPPHFPLSCAHGTYFLAAVCLCRVFRCLS